MAKIERVVTSASAKDGFLEILSLRSRSTTIDPSSLIPLPPPIRTANNLYHHLCTPDLVIRATLDGHRLFLLMGMTAQLPRDIFAPISAQRLSNSGDDSSNGLQNTSLNHPPHVHPTVRSKRNKPSHRFIGWIFHPESSQDHVSHMPRIYHQS